MKLRQQQKRFSPTGRKQHFYLWAKLIFGHYKMPLFHLSKKCQTNCQNTRDTANFGLGRRCPSGGFTSKMDFWLQRSCMDCTWNALHMNKCASLHICGILAKKSISRESIELRRLDAADNKIYRIFWRSTCLFVATQIQQMQLQNCTGHCRKIDYGKFEPFYWLVFVKIYAENLLNWCFVKVRF